MSEKEKIALMWFGFSIDSTKTDSAFNLSDVPFNWNNDTIFLNKNGLKNKKWGSLPAIIDTVFITDDSLKKFFGRTTENDFNLIEIQFYSVNGLRTNTILVAIEPSKNKVIGFFFLGDFRYRRKYGITGY